MNAPRAAHNALELARSVLDIEAEAVRALAERLDARFLAALDLVRKCVDQGHGRVIVSGIGKSGHIARKIASTLASTGTPAYFVHPAEASHGDLGMVRRQDVFVGISYSGETEELLRIVPLIKREGAHLIVITGRTDSPLAREADVVLDATVAREACPLNLAPTASTTAALALGDALAVALLDARGFSKADFARSHPRGTLYREALKHAADVMRRGDEVPAVRTGTSVKRALAKMTTGGMGMVAVVDARRRVQGIFTDGDLRRLIERGLENPRQRCIDEVMTRNPRTIDNETFALEALALLHQFAVDQMPVVDGDGVLLGLLDVQDLLNLKIG